MSISRSAVALCIVAGTVYPGCGSSADSTFGNGEGDGAGGGGQASNFGKVEGVVDNRGGVGGVKNVEATAACASAHEGAALQPISLVFMIDRSGSMESENDVSTIDVRWNPVKKGLLTFFGDAASANITASLAFFPIQRRRGDDSSVDCNTASYARPVVPATALPNVSAFSDAFGSSPDGRTPTAPALQGAIDSAKAEKATGKNVAVVLATDGEPNVCNSSVAAVENVASDGLAAGIKTHVIGVGPSTGNLNSFAAHGGTGAAIMIPTNAASQVSADLIRAVGQIASSLLGCNYGLPHPPPGQSLDVNAVNVNFAPPGSTSSTLAYSGDCANADGWRYDDTGHPSQIVLCPDVCASAQSAAGAKLDIIFGCSTQVPAGGTDPNGNIR